MPLENGVDWQPTDPHLRGRHPSMSSALKAAFADMVVQKNDFFDSLADNWKRLFPDLPARPGRYEDGIIFIYVRSAPLLYAVRPKMRQIAAKLAQLPGAPKKLNLKLEAHVR